MTALRQQMIAAMRQRGLAARTHQSYLGAVRDLARYFHQSPEQLQVNQIQDYFVHLVQERGLSSASCRLYLNALRFLYLQVLHWPHTRATDPGRSQANHRGLRERQVPYDVINLLWLRLTRQRACPFESPSH